MWQSPEFLDYLAADPVDGFVIAGVELRCCVQFAALGADERGYRFVIPQDLVSGLDTGDGSYNDAARRLLRELYQAPETANSLLAAWTSVAPSSQPANQEAGLTRAASRPSSSVPRPSDP